MLTQNVQVYYREKIIYELVYMEHSVRLKFTSNGLLL